MARGDVAFAIRGGGQQPLPGCANIQGGITLDLGLLVGSEIHDGIVEIAAGERWGPVYNKLHEKGLGVTGSCSAKGGIGGLALAGRKPPLQPFLSVFIRDTSTLQEGCLSSPRSRA